jgi:adenylate cyclase
MPRPTPPPPRLRPAIITAAVTALGLLAYLAGIPFLERVELETLDLRFRVRGPEAPESPVVLAAIDEASIDREGKWPWPRTKLARLVDRLTGAGAKVIAFDIGFLEPDSQWRELTNELREAAAAESPASGPAQICLNHLANVPGPDEALAEAIAAAEAAGVRVVLGFFFHTGGRANFRDPEAAGDPEEIRSALMPAAYPIQSATPDAAADRLLQAQAPEASIPRIAAAAGLAGHFNMVPDADGVVRRIPVVVTYQNDFFAPLSLMAAAAYAETPLAVRMDAGGVQSVRLGDTAIPVDSAGRMRINFQGPEGMFPYISVADILAGDPEAGDWREIVRGGIVIVGATAVGVYDVRVTPFDTVFPGPEIHATVVDNVLSGDFLQKSGGMVILDLLGMIGFGGLVGFLLARLGAIGGTAATLGLGSLWLGAAEYLFAVHGQVLTVIYPLLIIGALYASITLWRFLQESRQKLFIKNAFGHYVSPAVVEELIQSPEKLELRGEERNITAFFSDIQGFSRIAEQLEPRRLGELLNLFLTEMTDIILDHRGTVDKFEGDAIIAIFGAPNDVPDHPAVACRAAVAMQRRLAALRETWRARDWPEIRMRIGMCTGPAVVGNMGSQSRMDYTMIGDVVNTAARLEGINKFYGTYTAAAESTAAAVGEGLLAREVDRISPMGKRQPIRFFEIREETEGREREMMTKYAEGLAAYRNREWNRAISAFRAALEAFPEDGPSRVLLERCRQFQKEPPAPDWDGVFSASAK